ncbi:putative nucleic acid-binding protein, contains Zn-ribbon domain [Candidatus Methanophagaceae archaeon]|nr:putative nucleic acid-binding protein, contains Zn-ribbon domain [Methanophagales archaeon]
MHKCLKCGKKYEKMTEEMLKGCSECGGNLFLYLKDGEELEAKDIVERIQVEERVELAPEADRVESLKIIYLILAMLFSLLPLVLPVAIALPMYGFYQRLRISSEDMSWWFLQYRT